MKTKKTMFIEQLIRAYIKSIVLKTFTINEAKFGEINTDELEKNLTGLKSQLIMDIGSTPLGEGSSRIAFSIPGNDTFIIKIAKDDKGIAQNKFEKKFYAQHKSLNFLTDIVEDDANGMWQVVEKVELFKNAFEFQKATGTTESVTKDFVCSEDEHRRNFLEKVESIKDDKEKLKKLNISDAEKTISFFKKLIVLKAPLTEELKIACGDLARFDHYGIDSNGNIKLIDYGQSLDIKRVMYDKKQTTSITKDDGKTTAKENRGSTIKDDGGTTT